MEESQDSRKSVKRIRKANIFSCRAHLEIPEDKFKNSRQICIYVRVNKDDALHEE